VDYLAVSSISDTMHRIQIDEGKATLRLKHTMEDGKKDPVAYRIKFYPHHCTKDTWSVCLQANVPFCSIVLI
jgi:glutamyl/glutaminyl-tRNA synthetase